MGIIYSEWSQLLFTIIRQKYGCGYQQKEYGVFTTIPWQHGVYP